MGQAQEEKKAAMLLGAGRPFGKAFSRVGLRLAENAVDLGAADGADALSHATTRVRDFYGAFELTLLFALHAVSLTLVGLSHSCSSYRRLMANTLTIPSCLAITGDFTRDLAMR
jgi:hypothetical protein